MPRDCVERKRPYALCSAMSPATNGVWSLQCPSLHDLRSAPAPGVFRRKDCFALGVDRAYLCARLDRSGFYERLGWTPIERDVEQHHLSVFIRDANPDSGNINRLPP